MLLPYTWKEYAYSIECDVISLLHMIEKKMSSFLYSFNENITLIKKMNSQIRMNIDFREIKKKLQNTILIKKKI